MLLFIQVWPYSIVDVVFVIIPPNYQDDHMKNVTPLKAIQRLSFLFMLPFLVVFSLPALADCGGNTQCIGVGTSLAIAVDGHGAPAPTLTFGNLEAGSTSNAQTIYVAAVHTGKGTVDLNKPSISGADAAEFSITGGTCSDSFGPVHDGRHCTIEIAFNPLTDGAKSAVLRVTLPQAPDCANCITERTVNLTGSSGEVDPNNDQTVIGLVSAQAQTAKRFSRAQISNFQSRMDSLHRRFAQQNYSSFAIDSLTDVLVPGFDRQVAAKPVHSEISLARTSQNLSNQESLAKSLYDSLSSESLNLSYSSNVADTGGIAGGINIWVEGNINFGSRRSNSLATSKNLQFNSDGISIGIDKAFAKNLILGLGIGVADDRTLIGTDGSRSEAEANSLVIYSSFRLSQNFYLDALIGKSSVDYDSSRYVATDDSFVLGQRDADQWFASLSASYEYYRDDLLLAPYLRFDSFNDKLKAYSESGAGSNALHYGEESIDSNRVAAGLRIESAHKTNYGWVLPQLKLEWRQGGEDNRSSNLSYTNQTSATSYSLNTQAEDDDSLLLGIGSDFAYSNGLKLTAHYSLVDSSSSESDQAITFNLSKDLDGKDFLPAFSSSNTFKMPIQVSAIAVQNDNLSRDRIKANQLSDQIYRIKLGSRKTFSVSQHSRLILRPHLSSEKLATYTGLDKTSIGAKTEYQYRTSGTFDAITLGLFWDLSYDNYDSQLRSGNTNVLGISARQQLTGKVGIFGALENTKRDAKNLVFDTTYNALRVFIDYSLARSGVIYLGAQHRKGDLVSSTPDPFYYNAIALASAPDDAFTEKSLTATRFDAKTNIWTLGYNRPLGSRDSIDLAVMNIKSEASGNVTSVSYSTTQYSLAYIMRF
ncbi:MAG: hypothetical protein ACJASL_003828 [Paraglaciecola sp.]